MNKCHKHKHKGTCEVFFHVPRLQVTGKAKIECLQMRKIECL